MLYHHSLLSLENRADGGAGSDGTRKNWRRDLVEGLARAATRLPSEQASAAGLRMAGPLVDTLARLASGVSDLPAPAPFIAPQSSRFTDCPSCCPRTHKSLHVPAFLLYLHRLCLINRGRLRLVNSNE